MTKNEVISLVVALSLVVVILIPSLLFSKLDTAQAVQIILMTALVLVTIIYVKRTSEISEATRRQSQEVREQTIIASRPVIIQRALCEKDIWESNTSDYFVSFEIYNAGAGPAIELEILMLDKDKQLLQSEIDTFLRSGAEPIQFNPTNLMAHTNCTCYLLCRYRSILFSATDERWYQTWMPFDVIRASAKDKLYVKPHRLEFLEVVGKEFY